MQHLEGLVRKAVQDYEMIAPGDRICVGISGGKDSVALAVALGHLRAYLGIPFEVQALTLDPMFGGVETDYSPLAALFARENIPYEIRRTDIGPVVFDYRKEPNPCALCAKLRRGMLHSAARELGCNKIALGHHLDDAVETFYMNLWREGRIGCFSPVTWLSRRELTMIRPLLLATEAEVRSAVHRAGLSIVKSRCPADGVTVREDTKRFVTDMSRKDPAFRQKNLHALQESGIDGWAPTHTGRKKEWACAPAPALPAGMLATPHLLLRPFLPVDYEGVRAFASQPDVPERSGRPRAETDADARALLETYLADPSCLALVERSTGRVLGQLHIKPDSEEHRADTRELGFLLNADYHRRGLMREAVTAVLDALFAQPEIEYVYACCFVDNLPSKGLIEALGFAFAQEGTYYIRHLDKTVPSLEYVYTRARWLAR